MPVKRLPSKPESGWLVVAGMSAAVMPMRSTDCAPAPVQAKAMPSAASARSVFRVVSMLISL